MLLSKLFLTPGWIKEPLTCLIQVLLGAVSSPQVRPTRYKTSFHCHGNRSGLPSCCGEVMMEQMYVQPHGGAETLSGVRRCHYPFPVRSSTLSNRCNRHSFGLYNKRSCVFLHLFYERSAKEDLQLHQSLNGQGSWSRPFKTKWVKIYQNSTMKALGWHISCIFHQKKGKKNISFSWCR